MNHDVMRQARWFRSVIFMFLALCLLLLPLSSSVSAEPFNPFNQPSLSMSSAEGNPGETVKLAVTVDPGNDLLDGYQVYFSYDPTALEYITAIEGEEQGTAESFSAIELEDGEIKVDAEFTDSNDFAPEQEAFTVTFKIKDDAPKGSSLSITFDIMHSVYQQDGMTLKYFPQITNGNITILEAGVIDSFILSAIPGNGQVTLNWAYAGDASEFKIYQSESADGFADGFDPADEVETVENDNSYTVTGLENRKVYYFAVVATNESGIEHQSNIAVAMADELSVAKLNELLQEIQDEIINFLDAGDQKDGLESEAATIAGELEALEATSITDLASYTIYYKNLTYLLEDLLNLQIDALMVMMSEISEGGESDSKELTDLIEDLQGQLDQKQTGLDTLSELLENLYNDMDGLVSSSFDPEDLLELLDGFDDAVKEVIDSDTAFSDLGEWLGKLTNLVIQLQQEKQELENDKQQLEQAKQLLEEKIEELEDEIEGLKQDISTLTGTNGTLQGELEQMESALSQLQGQVEQLQGTNAEQLETIEQLNDQLEELGASSGKAALFVADLVAMELDFAADDSLAHVSQNFTVPQVGANGSTAEWESSNEEYVSINEGIATVTRPSYIDGDIYIMLTSTITLDSFGIEQQYLIRIVKAEPTDQEAVQLDKNTLTLVFAPDSGDSLASVTQHLSLQTAGEYGTEISWTSHNTAVITNNGVVTRPGYQLDNALVTLTAYITKGDVTESKTFVVNVLKRTQTAQEAVDAAKQALQIGYSTGDTKDAVTGQLLLPSTGADGTLITWQSNAANVISTSGAVNRPSAAQGNQAVTLTATISKASVTTTKQFQVTVRAFVSGKPVQLVTEGTGLGIQRDASGIRVTVQAERRDTADQPDKSIIVFQLMKGTEALSIVAMEKEALISEKASAGFFKINGSNSEYYVKVFVYDQLSADLTAVQTSLAESVELR